MFKLKKQNKVYRKYNQILWFNLIQKRKLNRVFVRMYRLKMQKMKKYFPFFLEIESKRPLKRRFIRTRAGAHTDTIKKLSYYYGGISKHRFKQLDIIAKKGVGSNYMDKFYPLLELRLSSVAFKLNVFNTILETMQAIYAGYILVNKEVKKNVHYIVKEGDVIEIISYKKRQCYLRFKRKLRKNVLITKQPHYMVINYRILCIYIFKKPDISHLKYPFKISKQYMSMYSSNKFY